MQPRREQPSITIRSAEAVRRLRELTRTGRSQVDVIEEALRRMPTPVEPERNIEARLAELEALVAKIPKGSIMTMEEFDALEYDENGDLRDR